MNLFMPEPAKKVDIKMRKIMLMALFVAAPAWAADLPTFHVEFKDGVVQPTQIEAPAGQKFKLEITNAGRSAAEFESNSLRKEKVVAAGAKSFVVIQAKDPGVHEFFDEFHPSAKGKIVIK